MNENKEVIKIDDSTIGVIETIPAEEKVLPIVQYNYDFLISQRDAIQAQKDRDNALRDAELEEVNFLISEANEKGVGVIAPINE